MRPSTGETYNIVGTTVSAEAMSAVLAQFATEQGVGPTRRIALVLDGAGWHTAKELKVPEGIHLVILPPYSPELQPAERLWPVINEVVANRTHTSLADLVATVCRRCVYLQEHPEQVRSLTAYHWWPHDTLTFRRES